MADYAKIRVLDSSPPDGGNIEFLWETSTTARYPLGQRVCLSNGAVFRYAKAGEAIDRQVVCCNATSDATEVGNAALCSGSTAAYAGAVGDMRVKARASGSTITENEFQGGQIVVTSHSGSLSSTQVLWIKSNPAAAASAECIMELYNPLQFTADSRCKCNFIKNPFNGVMEYDATPEAWPVGVSVCDIASASFGWLQTWGPTGAICGANFPQKGGCICCGSTTGGVVSSVAVTTYSAYYPIIGWAGPSVGVSGCVIPMFLTIMP